MPPKKAAAKEHNVFLIIHTKFNDGDEIGHKEIYQAHATLSDANENAEAKVNTLCATMDVEAPEPNDNDFTNDGHFHTHVNLATGSFSVEVVTMPLLGGTITPSKKPAPAKAAKKPAPKKAKSPSDEEEDGFPQPASPQTCGLWLCIFALLFDGRVQLLFFLHTMNRL